jgi:hypothetical protein
MSIELIALDLDDTLLHTDLTISDANRAALREAHRRGAKIVLASGRNIYSMKKYATQLGLDGDDDYIIASNGAEIVETRSARVLSETRLSPDLCRHVIEALAERGFTWQVYMDGMIFFNARNRWTDEDTRLSGLPNKPIDDVSGILAGGQLKFVVPGEPSLLPVLKKDLARLFAGRAEILISKPYFLEILADGVDKGRALAELAELLGIPLERTMAMGDAGNDIGMLQTAGFSCAPSNAVPEAKVIATWVSPLTNDQDFVADALVRHVLGASTS